MEIHLSICIIIFGILWKSYFVLCTDNIRDNSLRLVHPVVESAGRVEIYHAGKWGSVCDNGWGLKEAEVVCNQLGYPGAYSAVEDAYFGPGTGPIMLDNVYCKGWEHYLADCKHDGWCEHNCDHNEDAGVYCNLPDVHYPRLINGYTYYEGRLEIWNGIQWIKLCFNSIFNESEGYTVCKQLGYNGLDKIFNDDRFGEGNAPPATWGYSCAVNDESLLHCGVYPYNGSSCAATNVRCQTVTDDYLSGGAIAGIVIGVTMFFGFCLFSCIAVYTKSKAQKRRRGNSLEVANVGEATNTSGSTPSAN